MRACATSAARARAPLEFVRDEATARHLSGMSATEAALDIDLGEFAEWRDGERIMVNVDSIYRELDPDHEVAIPTPVPMASNLCRSR